MNSGKQKVYSEDRMFRLEDMLVSQTDELVICLKNFLNESTARYANGTDNERYSALVQDLIGIIKDNMAEMEGEDLYPYQTISEKEVLNGYLPTE